MDTNTPRYAKTSFRQKIALVIFGLFLTFIFIETGLRLGGFIILSLQERRNRASLAQGSEYRILCLGESTTHNQYPAFLEEALNRHNTGIKFSVIDKGLPAGSTPLIVSRLESYLDEYRPDMAITMMGINDCGPHIPYEPVSDSKAINFFKSLRTYKLTRLLGLHIVNRLNELRLNFLLRKSGLQEAYVEEGDVSANEELLKCMKAIELEPGNDAAHLRLGQFYRKQCKFSEAEASFRKAVELDPENGEAYYEIGRLYRGAEAEEFYEKAIELDPGNDWAYLYLGWCYRAQGKFAEAEETFRKAIEINPRYDWAYFELGRRCREQGKFPEAEELFKKAVEVTNRKDWAYGALEVLCLEMGNVELASKYAKEVAYLRSNYYSPATTSNYRKLERILDRRGVTYVCVQYPMRNIGQLKKIFQGNDKGIIFVDNEKIFKDAVVKYGYQNYFYDTFGGDFGHCTEKGNRLLAENIANVIVKEIFVK